MFTSTGALRASLLSSAAALVMVACEADSGFAPIDPELFVVQGYLFAGEPVSDFTVTSVLPIDSDSRAVPEPISDAQITLIRDGARFDLVPTSGQPGRYHYPGMDLNVRVGDLFDMEISHGGIDAFARTSVPERPTGLQLSLDSLLLPDFSNFDPRQGRPDLPERVLARWANPESKLHFVVVDNVEPNPEILPTTEIATRIAPRLIQTPTASDSSFVALLSLTHFGDHRLRVYRVNQEYSDLYEGIVQDSRDLNEPPSNIVGALGVFSAFSADSAFFVVARATDGS